jgi:hypothetical protein
MDDILSLFTADEPTAQQRAAALSAALRRQQAAGNLGLLTGDAVLSKFGNAQLQQAQQGQQQLEQVGQVRLSKALEAQRMREEAARHAEQLSETTRHNQATEEMGKWGHVVTPDGRVFKQDLRTGQMIPEAGGVGMMPGGGFNPRLEKEWKDLTESVSTYKGRGSLNRENQDRLNAAERLEALVLGEGGQIQNLTPQQVREAGTSLANLISKGSMSVSQIEELTPHTLKGQFANLQQKLFNEPTGADAQAFLQNMLETAGREKRVVLGQLHQGQMQGVPNYAHLRGIDRARFDSILKGADLDPGQVDDRGLPVKQPKSAEAGSFDVTGLSPEKLARLEELRRKKAAGTLK